MKAVSLLTVGINRISIGDIVRTGTGHVLRVVFRVVFIVVLRVGFIVVLRVGFRVVFIVVLRVGLTVVFIVVLRDGFRGVFRLVSCVCCGKGTKVTRPTLKEVVLVTFVFLAQHTQENSRERATADR